MTVQAPEPRTKKELIKAIKNLKDPAAQFESYSQLVGMIKDEAGTDQDKAQREIDNVTKGLKKSHIHAILQGMIQKLFLEHKDELKVAIGKDKFLKTRVNEIDELTIENFSEKIGSSQAFTVAALRIANADGSYNYGALSQGMLSLMTVKAKDVNAYTQVIGSYFTDLDKIDKERKDQYIDYDSDDTSLGQSTDSLRSSQPSLSEGQKKIKELIDTEENHLVDLRHFVEVFDKNPIETMRPMVDAIKKSIEAHEFLLAAFKEQPFPSNNVTVALTNLKKSDLDAILLYPSTSEYVGKNSHDKEIKALQEALGKNLEINSYLIKVVQLPPKYETVLDDIIKNESKAPTNNESVVNPGKVKALLMATKNMNRGLNEGKTVAELNHAKAEMEKYTKLSRQIFIWPKARKEARSKLEMTRVILSGLEAQLQYDDIEKLNRDHTGESATGPYLNAKETLAGAIEQGKENFNKKLAEHMVQFSNQNMDVLREIHPLELTKSNDVDNAINQLTSLSRAITMKENKLEDYRNQTFPENIVFHAGILNVLRLELQIKSDALKQRRAQLDAHGQKPEQVLDIHLALHVELVEDNARELARIKKTSQNMKSSMKAAGKDSLEIDQAIAAYKQAYQLPIKRNTNIHIDNLRKLIGKKFNAIPEITMDEKKKGKHIVDDLKELSVMLKALESAKNVLEAISSKSQEKGVKQLQEDISLLQRRQVKIMIFDIERICAKIYPDCDSMFRAELEKAVASIRKLDNASPEQLNNYLKQVSDTRDFISGLQSKGRLRSHEKSSTQKGQHVFTKDLLDLVDRNAELEKVLPAIDTRDIRVASKTNDNDEQPTLSPLPAAKRRAVGGHWYEELEIQGNMASIKDQLEQRHDAGEIMEFEVNDNGSFQFKLEDDGPLVIIKQQDDKLIAECPFQGREEAKEILDNLSENTPSERSRPKV